MKKNNFILIGLIGLTLSIVIFHSVLFTQRLNEQITASLYAQLSHTSSQAKISIVSHFNEQLSTLEAMADHLSGVDDLTSDEAILFINTMKIEKQFLRVAIEYPDGSFITNDSLRVESVSGKEHFQLSMQGKRSITGPVPAVVDPTKSVIVMSVPVYHGRQIVASLAASYDTEKLNDLFHLSFLEDKGYLFLANSNGDIISNVTNTNYFRKGDNLFSFLQQNCINPDRYTVLIDQMQNQESGVNFIESSDNEISYMHFTYIGINDWYIFSLAPAEVMRNQMRGIEREIVNLGVVVAICVLILVGFIIFMQVTARRKAVLNERCFHVLAEQTGKIIFEWNFATNRISTLYNFKEQFGRDAVTQTSANDAIKSEMVHPDDCDAFEKVFEDIKNCKNVDKVKFRIKDADTQYHWCCISGVVITGSRGKPYKAIGSLENIDEQERESEILRQKASRDALTGLYNKTTTEFLVNDLLQSTHNGGIHAMISADLDHFKDINDSFGHLFGDQVLKEVAKEMKDLFRSTDILGRFGGDEFVLFIRDIPSVDFIRDKANELVRRFEKSYCVNDMEHHISISAGISIYPNDGTTYEELYQKADQALYHAKRTGKNMYCLFEEQSSQISC